MRDSVSNLPPPPPLDFHVLFEWPLRLAHINLVVEKAAFRMPMTSEVNLTTVNFLPFSKIIQSAFTYTV
jgi:hypothetical protein